MEFDKECKVIINSMDKVEAQAFLKFLLSEIKRHHKDIREARCLIVEVADKFGLEDWLND